jgi:cysteinyl-tRNA synthetase
MAMKYLGEQIDIHGGGQDLVFPIMRMNRPVRMLYGKRPFREILAAQQDSCKWGREDEQVAGQHADHQGSPGKNSPDAVGIHISSHFRSPLSLSEEGLEGAEKGAERLARSPTGDSDGKNGVLNAEEFKQQFIEAMDDDFNTAKATRHSFRSCREINLAADSGADIPEPARPSKSWPGTCWA